NDLEEEKEVSEEDLKRVAEKYQGEYAMSSAMTGENVERIFEGLTNEIFRRIMERKYPEDVSVTSRDGASKQVS
ncbi:MAG: hypothetical protein V3U51_01700, partial [Thermoplasmata archaeon]